MNQIDIYRSAKFLLDQHGESAGTVAAMRADEFLERGDIDGAVVWRRIMRAIEELSAKVGPKHGEHVH